MAKGTVTMSEPLFSIARTGAMMLTLAVAWLGAQTGGRTGGAPVQASPVQQVRVALGRGQVADARKQAEAIQVPASRDLASALVDIFEGKDAAARAKLEPLANANRLGDAAVELGLLEIRHGQRQQGYQRLDVIASHRTFNNADDYFRLARAARGIREFMLSNDAFLRIQSEPRADIQTEWGDVAHQRFKYGDATTSYTEALNHDRNWVRAYIGLARALAEDDPEAARNALTAARKLAPNHPDVLVLAAERELEIPDADAAAKLLDEAAAVRADFVEEAALRAAVAYARNDLAGIETAAARVRAIDATSALAYRRAGQQAARAYRFEDAAELARKAVAIDPDDPYAQFDLGLYLTRTGDEKAARVALERSWDLDRSSPLTKNLLDVLDRIDTFETVTHGEFIFKFPKNEAAVLRTYALPLADEAAKVFGARYNFKPSGPILIELFDIHDDFAVRTVGLGGLVGALGACFGKVIVMDSPRARPQGEFSWQATLWHELAHVYSLQASQYRVPRWLTEGISVYEEYKRVPAWGRELALEFAAQHARGRSFGVKALPDAFKRPESLALAYFEASLLVEHLVELNGDAGLRTLLAAYAAGDKDPAAFARAFARSVDDVEKSFRTFVDTRFAALGRAMAEPPGKPAADDIPGLRALAAQAPGNFLVQITLGRALMRAGDLAGAREPLERAATLAPQASGSGSPRGLLAEIAEREGDLPAARAHLRQLLDVDHANVEAARKLLALAAKEPPSAALTRDRDFALRLVADVDPFDADVHVRLGRRLFETNDFTNALKEFQAALALGPSNPAEAQTDVAETLLKVGRKDEAKRYVLLALQQAPTYPRAQDILLAIVGR
jgi:tetratricopeptide (TPR) repeat protein